MKVEKFKVLLYLKKSGLGKSDASCPALPNCGIPVKAV